MSSAEQQVLIFVNPMAGRGHAGALAEQAAAAVRRAGFLPNVFTDRADSIDLSDVDPTRLRAAVVIGGDGTLRAVVKRMLPWERIPAIVLLPLGTANLMAMHLGIERRPDSADTLHHLLHQGQSRSIDLAAANGEPFLLMAGAGLDAAVVHTLAAARRGPIRKSSYFLPTVRTVARFRYPPVTVDVDGRRIATRIPASVFVANVREYGTGVAWCPGARSDDGLLDVSIVPGHSLYASTMVFLHAAVGELAGVDGAIQARGREIFIDAPRPLEVQVDGDACGFTPLHIRLLGRQLTFIVA